MSMLQVKNLPDDLHAALAERARAEGTTMSEYVTRLLRRDLARPSMTEWIAEQREHAATESPRRIDIVAAMDTVRLEYDGDASPAETARPSGSRSSTPRSSKPQSSGSRTGR